jgi:hypothetical protein
VSVSYLKLILKEISSCVSCLVLILSEISSCRVLLNLANAKCRRPRKSTPGQVVAPQAGGERETQTATDSVVAGSVADAVSVFAGSVADAGSVVASTVADAGSVVAGSVADAETQTASDEQVESLRELPEHTHTDFNEDEISASAAEPATSGPATESATEAVTRAEAQVPIETDTNTDAERAGQESREKAADAAKAASSSLGAPREDGGNGANSENSIVAIEEEEEAVTQIAGGSVREWRGYREEAVGEETAREEEEAQGKEEVGPSFPHTSHFPHQKRHNLLQSSRCDSAEGLRASERGREKFRYFEDVL